MAPVLAPVLGRPPQSWLQLFLLSHQQSSEGWRRLAWPDGGPLLAQPWPDVLIYQVLGEELNAVHHERRRETKGGSG